MEEGCFSGISFLLKTTVWNSLQVNSQINGRNGNRGHGWFIPIVFVQIVELLPWENKHINGALMWILLLHFLPKTRIKEWIYEIVCHRNIHIRFIFLQIRLHALLILIKVIYPFYWGRFAVIPDQILCFQIPVFWITLFSLGCPKVSCILYYSEKIRVCNRAAFPGNHKMMNGS